MPELATSRNRHDPLSTHYNYDTTLLFEQQTSITINNRHIPSIYPMVWRYAQRWKYLKQITLMINILRLKRMYFFCCKIHISSFSVHHAILLLSNQLRFNKPYVKLRFEKQFKRYIKNRNVCGSRRPRLNVCRLAYYLWSLRNGSHKHNDLGRVLIKMIEVMKKLHAYIMTIVCQIQCHIIVLDQHKSSFPLLQDERLRTQNTSFCSPGTWPR